MSHTILLSSLRPITLSDDDHLPGETCHITACGLWLWDVRWLYEDFRSSGLNRKRWDWESGVMAKLSESGRYAREELVNRSNEPSHLGYNAVSTRSWLGILANTVKDLVFVLQWIKPVFCLLVSFVLRSLTANCITKFHSAKIVSKLYNANCVTKFYSANIVRFFWRSKIA